MMNETHVNSTHVIPKMTLANYCCISKEMKLVQRIESIAHIIDVTKKCFVSDTISDSQKFKMLLSIKKYEDHAIFNQKNCFNTFENEHCHKATPESQYIVYFIFWLVVLLIGFFGNFAVLLSVYRSSNLRAIFTNYFIASLAVSDLLVSSILVPMNMRFALDNLFFCSSHVTCRFRMTLDMTLFVASITNLFVIAIDRFCALVQPYAYPELLTSKRARIIVVGIWSYAALWGALANVKWEVSATSPLHKTDGLECVVDNRYFTTVVFGFNFYIPAVSMAFIYSRIFIIARRHATHISATACSLKTNYNEESRSAAIGCKNNHLETQIDHDGFTDSLPLTTENSPAIPPRSSFVVDESQSPPKKSLFVKFRKKDPSPNNSSKRMIFRITKTVATVYGLFLICWFPVSIISLVRIWGPPHVMKESLEMKWVHVIFVEVLPIFNSICNPFIYALMSEAYRHAFLRLWRDCINQFCRL